MRYTYAEWSIIPSQTRATAIARYPRGGSKRQKQRRVVHKVCSLRTSYLVLPIMRWATSSEKAHQYAGAQYFRTRFLHDYCIYNRKEPFTSDPA